MATLNKNAEEYGSEVSRTKSYPWYAESFGDNLTPACRDLLVEYSKIPENSVMQHIYEVRDYAWEIFPFPCIGGFWFLALGLSKHPQYDHLLTRLKAPGSTARLLDVGTCLGQDLRKLAFDGVPISSLYGTDILSEYEGAGYKFFNDADRFTGHFLVMDFLSDEPDTPLEKTKGSWDVLTATMFLHIFDWPSGKKACRQMLQLVVGEGSWIMGASSATLNAGEQLLKPPFVKEGEQRSIYRHSKESFTTMWEEVAKEMGRNISVSIEYEKYTEEDAKKQYFKAERRMWYFIEVLK